MAFFFPEAHRDIDWTRPFEMLDKELQQITPESEQGSRVVDKLVKDLAVLRRRRMGAGPHRSAEPAGNGVRPAHVCL